MARVHPEHHVTTWRDWHTKRIAHIMEKGKVPQVYAEHVCTRCCSKADLALLSMLSSPIIILELGCWCLCGRCQIDTLSAPDSMIGGLVRQYEYNHRLARRGVDRSTNWSDISDIGFEYLNAFDKCMTGGTKYTRVQWAKRANILRDELRQMLSESTTIGSLPADTSIDRLRDIVRGITAPTPPPPPPPRAASITTQGAQYLQRLADGIQAMANNIAFTQYRHPVLHVYY